MEIIVCIKQVPDSASVKIDPETNTLMRQGVPAIVNPFDMHALEAALQLKEQHGGTVTVVTMGPPQATEALRECIALGADKGILVSDRAFGGSDTLATSYTLASAVRKIGKFDLILCGMQAIDGDTAQVGPSMAEELKLAQVTFVCKIDINGENVTVQREQDECYEVVEAKLPLLMTVVRSINDPRFPNVKGIMKAKKATFETLGAADLEVDETRLGLKGSPTKVSKIFSPPQRANTIQIKKDTAQEAVAELLTLLTDAKIV
jgi:electron transfer flavoprotein alpha/beta subunit